MILEITERKTGIPMRTFTYLTLIGLSCLTLLVVALAASASSTTIYKCTTADGSVAYRDSPCDGPATQQEMNAPNRRNPPAVTAPVTTPSTDVHHNAAYTARDADELKDCDNWMPPPRTVDIDPPSPPPDLSAYPRDDKGRTILVPGHFIELVVKDKPDAITVARNCSEMITKCWHKNNDPAYSMDACFNSAPRCMASRPWTESVACCPASCRERYAELRRKCVDTH